VLVNINLSTSVIIIVQSGSNESSLIVFSLSEQLIDTTLFNLSYAWIWGFIVSTSGSGHPSIPQQIPPCFTIQWAASIGNAFDLMSFWDSNQLSHFLSSCKIFVTLCLCSKQQGYFIYLCVRVCVCVCKCVCVNSRGGPLLLLLCFPFLFHLL